MPTGESYGRTGALEVRLARGAREVHLAQRLRYLVFYQELSAQPTREAGEPGLDQDAHDAVCDHLLVIDHGGASGRAPAVVGTCRILRGEVAAAHGLPLYSAGEFDIAPLLALDGGGRRLMEVGRSCVVASHRSRRTLELLWHGLWTYCRRHGADVMLGCASFDGVEPGRHAEALAYLHRHHLAPPEWRCRAHVPIELPAKEESREVAPRAALLRAMPPLIKGYLRLGAWIGDGAVVDRQFGTIDVLVILPVERINPRYFEHFGGPAERGSSIA